ncbi:hypothetical protein BH11PSE8_BH11PSE8_18220 [soil metagenome]
MPSLLALSPSPPVRAPRAGRSAARAAFRVVVGIAFAAISGSAGADLPDAIDRIKRSVVVVGTYNPTAAPRFQMKGTGFAVGDGNLVLTNAHVVEPGVADAGPAPLMVQVWVDKTERQGRAATLIDTDKAHDLALLRIEGAPLRPLVLADSASVREGQAVAFMGFPIGGALGFSPVTHRGTISSITPVALPTPTAGQLNEQAITRIREGTFDIFQLDGTAYPGNSGGPLFDPQTGGVLGVVNMTLVKGSRESALSQPSGISYAIPATFVVQLLQRNKQNR